MKYYVNEDGYCIGAFVGMAPPIGAIEVPLPPADARDRWDGGAWIAYVEQPTKQALLDGIKVTVNGKVFDGDETARNDMATAILLADVTGQTATNWKLANNAIAEVTLQELQQALYEALTEKGRIIGAIT